MASDDYFNFIWPRYRNLAGWLTKSEAHILFDNALKVSENGVIVEIGSWKGKSSIFIASALKYREQESLKKTNIKLYCIDPFTGSEEHQMEGPINTFDEFQKNINDAQVKDYICPVIGYSQDVMSQIPEKVDMMFIDGDHSYEGVKRDFDLYYPKLENDSVILFHDTVWWRGVHRLMREKIFFNPEFNHIEWVGSIIKAKKSRSNIIDSIKKLYIYSAQYIYFTLGVIKAKILVVKQNKG